MVIDPAGIAEVCNLDAYDLKSVHVLGFPLLAC
jgi:hypothetical protein